MSMLEEKIRKNRDLFDGAEPSEEHLDKFQEKLDALHEVVQMPKPWYLRKSFRVAAVIVILMGLSLSYYLIDPGRNASQVMGSALPQEIQEARMYYNKLASEKLDQINQCASNSSEASYIHKVVSEEMTILDSNSVELEKELQADKGNEKLINALIRNYKTKSDLLDNILNRICHI